MSSTRPTKKQRELLSFIEAFITGHGYGPSYREIMSALGYRSVSTVATHIDNLITRGHLHKRDNSARSLEIIRQAAVQVDSAETVPRTAPEQWFIDFVDRKFAHVEATPEAYVKNQLDELGILTATLSILGLETAANAYKSRLQVLLGKL